jgi:hypothetical protein
MSFHLRLLELEAELLAKEHSIQSLGQLSAECEALLEFVENEIGLRLADKVSRDWKGWLSYRRLKNSLIICRGRAFRTGMFGDFRAGCDVPHGLDSITDYQRHFDVSPPPDLDNLMLNFGFEGEQLRVFLWYGENIAAYRLIFASDVSEDPHHQLTEAIVEACVWILKRPKDVTLMDFLRRRESTT